MAKKKVTKKVKSSPSNTKILIISITSTVGLLVITLLAGAFLSNEQSTNVQAANDCDFSIKGNTMILKRDCTTSQTIFIPEGVTLDGRNRTITAIDPVEDHFKGAVVKNGGTTAHIKNVHITTHNLANACDAGNDRLRGILFEGAAGSITNNTVTQINQGASGCQEGNAIEVRKEPFDGTHPATVAVEVSHNTIERYQKTGIVANGDVNALIQYNKVGSADLSNSLAANSVQFGFGALGKALQNQVEGNQWCGPSDFVATAFLLFQTNAVEVSKNIIGGNSDVGVYDFGDKSRLDNNKVTDASTIVDCNVNEYDYGIGSWGTDPQVTNNKVSGFDVAYDGVDGGKNKTPGSGPQKGNPWF